MKRARWLATGVALGAGGTIWARKRLEALQGRLEPARVAGSVAGMTRDRVKAAVGAGRAQAHRREDEIRSVLDARRQRATADPRVTSRQIVTGPTLTSGPTVTSRPGGSSELGPPGP